MRKGDTFVLFRAIGNDLPPRHSVGQTYTNVRFILEHEPTHKGLSKRWLLNRIVNRTEELRLVSLLVQHRQHFVRDPLNYSEYIEFTTASRNATMTALHNVSQMGNWLSGEPNLRRWDDVFKQQNLYIIQNNEARNKMIRLGIDTGATFVLPWDGNCFLNRRAWTEISSDVAAIAGNNPLLPHVPTTNESAASPRQVLNSSLYFAVPMARMLSNDDLLSDTFRPPSVKEEPQLIFHRSSVARFNGALPYGSDPKIDMLRRLGVSRFVRGSASRWRGLPYSAPDVPGYNSVRYAGWTARLFSGVRSLEGAYKWRLRGNARSMGIEAIAAEVDRNIAERRFRYSHPHSTLLYEADALRDRLAVKGGPLADANFKETTTSLMRDTQQNMSTPLTDSGGGWTERQLALAARNASALVLAGLVAGDGARLRRAAEVTYTAIRSPDWLVGTAEGSEEASPGMGAEAAWGGGPRGAASACMLLCSETSETSWYGWG